MQLSLYNSKGKKIAKKVELEDSVFARRTNKILMKLAVYVYLSNQRVSTAHAKTRSEVRGGGVKPWRQKGTGRARAGSIRSPIWKGGGVVFGPRNVRNYKKKMSKNMKKAAIKSAFSYFASEKKIVVLESVDLKDKYLTKQTVELTAVLPVEKKVLYIQDGKQQKLYLGSRNLKKINVINVNEVNVYTLLNHDYLVIFKDALDDISKFWGKGSKEKLVGKKMEKSKEIGKKKYVSEKKTLKKEKDEENVLEDLGLSRRIVNALSKQNIKTKVELGDAIKSGKKIKGVGEKSLEEIKKTLKIN
jgi:large subunit ribosomal protein L4